VVDGLATLVDHSLVVPREQADGSTRYAMLETIREFAIERLAESGEEDRVRRTHLDWILTVSEEAEPHLRGAEQAEWLARLGADDANAGAALDWTLAHDGDAALRLAAARVWFWSYRGRVAEGRAALARALATGAGAESTARVRALNGASGFALGQGDLADARARAEEAFGLADRIGDRGGTGMARLNQAIVAWTEGDAATAATAVADALVRLREAGERWALALGTSIFGYLTAERGDLDLAAAVAEEALALFRRHGSAVDTAGGLLGLAWVERRRGNTERAERLATEALGLCHPTNDRFTAHAAGSFLGALAYDRGDFRRLAATTRDNLLLGWEQGMLVPVADGLFNVGLAAGAAGRPAPAARLLGAAEAAYDAAGVPLATDPFNLRLVERHVAALRGALGEAAFASARATGRALAAKDAVAEAVALADEIAGLPGAPEASR
jgi:tetratricopeptide (TPR) repeat protein